MRMFRHSVFPCIQRMWDDREQTALEQNPTLSVGTKIFTCLSIFIAALRPQPGLCSYHILHSLLVKIVTKQYFPADFEQICWQKG